MSKQAFKSPKGDISWAFLSGKGHTNLQGKQEYCITITAPLAVAQASIDEINAFWDENKPKSAKKAKSLGYKMSEDGKSVSFSLKTSTTYTDGNVKKIRVYNAKAQEIELPEDQKVGNGSRGRATGTLAIYDQGVAAQGVTIYLNDVQITKFVPYAGKGAGFEAEEDEGGFEGFASPSFMADDEV